MEPTCQHGKRQRGATQEGNPLKFPFSHAKHRHILTITFVTCWVASLTGLCLLVCVVVLWAGAVTLSLGAQEKEICIASLAVCGPWAPACFAALITLLTPTTGAFSIISETKRGAEIYTDSSVSEGIGRWTLKPMCAQVPCIKFHIHSVCTLTLPSAMSKWLSQCGKHAMGIVGMLRWLRNNDKKKHVFSKRSLFFFFLFPVPNQVWMLRMWRAEWALLGLRAVSDRVHSLAWPLPSLHSTFLMEQLPKLQRT